MAYPSTNLSWKRHNSLDWLKWAAVLSMTLDHFRYIPPLEHLGLYTLGRPAFPVFALLCGWNIATYSSRPLGFIGRVLSLAALLAILQSFSIQGFWPINPVFNLASGLLLCLPLAREKHLTPHILFGSLAMGAALALLTIVTPIPLLAYNWAGMGLVLAGALAAKTFVCKSHYLWQYLSWILTGILAWQVNGPIESANMIALCSALLSLWLLIRNPLPPCPLPNNYWLYLSFPLSMLPAILWHLWAGK